MRSKLLASSLLFLSLFSISTGASVEQGHAAKGSLGLVFEILPSSDPEINRLSAGQALWFVIPPGQIKIRQVRVLSSSTISQVITLSVGYLNRINGIATIDDSKNSETDPWAINGAGGQSPLASAQIRHVAPKRRFVRPSAGP